MGDPGTMSQGTIQLTVTEVSKRFPNVLSPPISVQNLQWRILVNPKPILFSKKTSPGLGFYLKCDGPEKTSKWECNATAVLILRAQNSDCEDFIKEFRHNFNPDEDDWGYSWFINWSQLMDPNKGFVQNDSIKLEVRLIADPPTGIRTENEFQNTLENILHDAQFSDFTVLTDAGTTFNVHKCILAARSEYFRVMLTASLIESNSNQTSVPDFSDPVVRGMLEYVYTGKTEILVEFAEEWLRIGDMYKLDGLKADAGKVISANVDIQNAAALFDAAWLYNVPFLQLKVAEFIKKNRAAVLSTAGFKEICKANPDRVAELIEAIST